MFLKKLLICMSSVALICACAFFSVTAEDGENKLRVMPLGDSITDGYWLQGGYRTTLCNMLQENGYSEKIDFVGPNWGGDCYDPNHAGYSGYSIDNIDQSDSISGGRVGISSFIEQLLSDYPADVVMLQIGTNDILSYYDMDNMGARLEKLVNIILNKINDGGKVYLATIPCMDANNTLYINEYYFTPEFMDETVDKYNGQVKELAAKLKAEGKNVELADINSLLSKNDLFDGVHPSAEGYKKMGEYWYSVLEKYLNDGGNDMPSEATDSSETTVTADTTVTASETSSETTVDTSVTPSETSSETTADTSVTLSDTDFPVNTALLGDVNSDGFVNTADLVLMQRYITALLDYKQSALENWDMNDDDVLNVYDVILLKRLIINN